MPLFALLTISPRDQLDPQPRTMPRTIPEQIEKINRPRKIDSSAIDTANPIEK